MQKLPPWSLMLNPFEKVFAIWKFETKRNLAEADVRNDTMAKNILKREGLIALAVINPAKCWQFYKHSLLFLYKAIREIDL